jgi:hypothetical protein
MTRTLTLRPGITRMLAVALLTLLLAAATLVISPLGNGRDTATAASRMSRTAFHDAMRELWEDHIVWTRMVIVSVVDDLPDVPMAVDRLLANQDEIGDAVKPFYGDAAGEALTALLREHITGAADLLAAAKSGDAVAVETASAAWYANGDEIAAFLAAANPDHWPLGEMQTMMRDHLDLTLAEAVARLQGRYADDIVAYDAIHAQILHMADMLSDGIVAQFPGGFGRANQ